MGGTGHQLIVKMFRNYLLNVWDLLMVPRSEKVGTWSGRGEGRRC